MELSASGAAQSGFLVYTSGGSDYIIEQEILTVTVVPDDELTVSFENAPYTAFEGGAGAVVTVSLSGTPDSEVVVTVDAQSGGEQPPRRMITAGCLRWLHLPRML